MAKSPDHLYWRDLRGFMQANGMHSQIAAIEAHEKAARDELDARRDLINAALAEVIANHQAWKCRVAFRPCHASRLAELSVYTYVEMC